MTTNSPHNDCHCKLNNDVDLATRVQQLLFPRSTPVCDWCCIGVKNQMAGGLGGDFFDFIRMPDGCQTLFLGDVTGHGLHASVVMSLIYGYIHRATVGICDPLATVSGINSFLRSFADRSERLDHFFSTTLFFATIDPKSLHMHYINCGQVAPLIRRNEQLIRLEPTAPPLGFFEVPDIHQGSFTFRPGDRILLHTDGISEATNSRGEPFGSAGVEEALLTLAADHLEFLDGLYQRMLAFGCITPPRDDCTAIVLDFHNHLPGSAT